MFFMLKPLVRVRDRRWLVSNTNVLAARLADAVALTLSSQIVQMSKAEVRGYVRAKLMPFLERELERIAVERPALRDGVAPQFVEALIDRVIRLTLDDVTHGRVVRSERRRAA